MKWRKKNKNANTLWEIITGGIRNEYIKYASDKKKNETERQLIEGINLIKDTLNSGNDQENELIRLKEKIKNYKTYTN